MTDSIMQQAEALRQSLIACRRDLHRHPELGYQEHRTAGIVAEALRELGMEVRTGVAQTGVVGLLEGEGPGPTLMLRFDMDALPIQEETGAPYASSVSGVMHACGHDGHTAIGLAVARLLHARRGSWNGRAKFVFQPAEEGLGGAARMVQDGVLEAPEVDYALGLHLWNARPVGWMGITGGPVMAGADKMKVRVRGSGAHAAAPHQAHDPVVAAAHIVTALQTVISRDLNPLHAAVLSVTTIRCGKAFNVIPSEAEMEGTLRTFHPHVREMIIERVREIAAGVAQGLGCEAGVEVELLTPAVVNDIELARRVQQVAGWLWPQATIESDARTMMADDVAVLMNEVPGCYVLLGANDPQRGLDAPHHNPRFDFDEESLVRGAALLAAAAQDLLG